MRTGIIYSLLCILFVTTFEYSYAQNASEDQQAIEMLNLFYTAYSPVKFTLQGWSKMDSLQRRYCTKRLSKKLKLLKIESDLLTNDFGIDSLGLKTLSISKYQKAQNIYTVSYTILDDVIPNVCKKEVKVIINVTVQKENGIFKIDDIK